VPSSPSQAALPPSRAVGHIQPTSFSRTPPSIDRHPPRQGEHTVEVLEQLGYASQDIRAMVG
jgi:crotonobetainyl-CoA:carnitine CoA-transferase CaiB-like acyl-CoA transferase